MFIRNISGLYIDSDDKILKVITFIEGYNLIRAHHQGNKKRGVLCMHYNDYLRIIRRDDLCTFHEYLVSRWNEIEV